MNACDLFSKLACNYLKLLLQMSSFIIYSHARRSIFIT